MKRFCCHQNVLLCEKVHVKLDKPSNSWVLSTGRSTANSDCNRFCGLWHHVKYRATKPSLRCCFKSSHSATLCVDARARLPHRNSGSTNLRPCKARPPPRREKDPHEKAHPLDHLRMTQPPGQGGLILHFFRLNFRYNPHPPIQFMSMSGLLPQLLLPKQGLFLAHSVTRLHVVFLF